MYPKSSLSISSDGHYLTKDNKPFFWMGDTLWPVYNLYSLEETEYYFERRRQQGFNVIHTMIAFDGGPGIVAPASNEAGALPWLNNNPATPNESFFFKVDKVIKIAEEKDIVLVIMPLGGSSGSFVKQKEFFTAKNVRAYGKWIGQRYKNSSNIIWANGADLQPWDYEGVYRELTKGLIEGDDGNHLITFHPCGGYSSNYFHKEDWLAFNIIQTWDFFWQIYPMVSVDYQLTPSKPVVLAEGAYEAGPEYPSAPITPYLVRKQAYWAYLAGGFHSYGHGDMWRKNPSWKTSLDSPGAYQMNILREFFLTREWWNLVPDQSILINGNPPKPPHPISDTQEGRYLHAGARSKAGDWIIAYLCCPTEVVIDLRKIISSTTTQAKWMNPMNGEYRFIGNFPNNKAQVFLPPNDWEDAILLVEGGNT